MKEKSLPGHTVWWPRWRVQTTCPSSWKVLLDGSALEYVVPTRAAYHLDMGHKRPTQVTTARGTHDELAVAAAVTTARSFPCMSGPRETPFLCLQPQSPGCPPADTQGGSHSPSPRSITPSEGSGPARSMPGRELAPDPSHSAWAKSPPPSWPQFPHRGTMGSSRSGARARDEGKAPAGAGHAEERGSASVRRRGTETTGGHFHWRTPQSSLNHPQLQKPRGQLRPFMTVIHKVQPPSLRCHQSQEPSP